MLLSTPLSRTQKLRIRPTFDPSVNAVVMPSRLKPTLTRQAPEEHFYSTIEPDSVASELEFFHAARCFLDLLAAVQGTPIVSMGTISHCTNRWANWILGMPYSSRLQMHGRVANILERSRHTPEPDLQALEVARRAFAHRSDDRYMRLSPAITRVAEALSRSGRYALEDRILDLAIALERMYELTGSEISTKLKGRVAWFLGTSFNDRLELWNGVNSFYRIRSKIVHGVRSKGFDDKVLQAYEDGLSITQRTLIKLLESETPDWNKIILGTDNQVD